ncbi:ABC transporter ATP-binding protein [Halomicroarcula sp. GCM10025709]|uniref:ABC transporter ATP-binding protein n=1 Tax=Haloarcula TaxID=2237 RepID=UPI0024C29490|nr:ABC transporter ATP-binding protein [Halomicroarcula sp. YJ-61-S]
MTDPGHLRLHDLTKVYDGSVRAVDGVDLSVAEGEFVTLVGPSGCGKSTTLRMLAGFVEPTDGVVEMDYTDITHHLPEKRDIGMVFQSIALFPHKTVKENIAYGMRVADESYSESEIDDRVAEMLELIEMPGYQDRMPDQLSGGQAQRIGLARALAPQPEILLLDEPLSALDEKLRQRMETELTRIQRELGVTTIFVTHNQEEAMTMSDRIVVMDDGEFAQIGSPSEVYDEPSTLFVGEFMGKSNVFAGTVDDDGRTLHTNRRSITFDADVSPGTEATVLLRPEHISIASEEPTSAANVMTGTVELAQLTGPTVEYEVKVDDETVLTVAEQSSGSTNFAEGDTVAVSFEAGQESVFPASDDPAVDETATPEGAMAHE